MKPYLWHPKLVIKLIDMPCDKRKPGNTKIRVQIARNVSKNGVKTKRAALLHRDVWGASCSPNALASDMQSNQIFIKQDKKC